MIPKINLIVYLLASIHEYALDIVNERYPGARSNELLFRRDELGTPGSPVRVLSWGVWRVRLNE